MNISKELLIMVLNKTIHDWASGMELDRPEHEQMRDRYVDDVVNVLEKAEEKKI